MESINHRQILTDQLQKLLLIESKQHHALFHWILITEIILLSNKSWCDFEAENTTKIPQFSWVIFISKHEK